MASIPFKKIKLTQNDVPCGTLGVLPPEKCSKNVLRKFIQTREFPTSGMNKPELVALAKQIEEKHLPIADDAAKGRVVVEKAQALRKIDLNANSADLEVFPVTGWKPFPSSEIPHDFHFGSIYTYLIDSAYVVDSDGEMDGLQQYGTKKPLPRGRQYFRSGHVKDLYDALTKSKRYCFTGVVRSSMKEIDYTVMVMMGSNGDVLDAECHCRGSAMQRCSHVAAVLIAIEDYTSLFGYSPPACTSIICSWNQGGKEKRAVTPVYHFQYSNIRNPSRAINFNTNVMTNPQQVNNGLLALTSDIRSLFPNGTKWETILDFIYEDYVLDEDRKAALTVMVNQFMKNLTFGFQQPTEVPNTRGQSSSDVWHGLRRVYITASVVKRFLHVPRRDVCALLRAHMWYPPTFTSKYTAWGVENEMNAKKNMLTQLGTPSWTVACG